MSTLPPNLYSADQCRELDRIAIEECGMSANILMERAGEAAFNIMLQQWPQATRICVLCGTGNNGGDGFVVARLAQEKNLDITVYQVGDSNKLQGDALAAMQRLLGADVTPEAWQGQSLLSFDVIVDALLGTGVSGDVSDEYRPVIDAINGCGKPVLALDVPSGFNATTGKACGVAVKADHTVTFIGLKQGLLTGDAPDHCGKVSFESLNIPNEVYEKLATPALLRLDYLQLKHLLRKRSRNAHKGQFGHVLIIGGDLGMPGATRLAGEAALRAGAGLVSIATRPEHAATISATRPELMCHGISNEADLAPLLKKADVVAIGPGLGQSDWAKMLLGEVIPAKQPVIVDADALNLLGQENMQRTDWVLTPHPGEAARLLACSITEIQGDRMAAVRALQQKYQGVIALKGSGTLVAAEETIGLCHAGNPGMATAGTGDILTGIIAALVAQGLSLADAAQLGVCLHAAAGDGAAQPAGERGMLASDIMPWIRRLANS